MTKKGRSTDKALEELGEEAKALGNKIKEVRTKKKMSIKDLVSLTHLDGSYLEKIETAERVPNFDDLQRIARALNVDLRVFTDVLSFAER